MRGTEDPPFRREVRERDNISGQAENVCGTIVDVVGGQGAHDACQGVPRPKEPRREICDLMASMGSRVGPESVVLAGVDDHRVEYRERGEL